jgi:GNAT superfamily N-acetyltransferase
VVDPFLRARFSDVVARRGVLVDARRHAALLAEEDGHPTGVLTYIIDGADCEVLTLHAAESWRGVGTALLAQVADIARRAGCGRLWLITTNDNVDALRFYQRRGFRIVAVYPRAVEDSRARLKPAIPATGAHGIPLRDELELELEL